MAKTLYLGLDIGTTNVSAVVLDSDTGVVASGTEKSCADIPSGDPGEKLQDPEKILNLATAIVDSLVDQYPAVGSIGITGQMHGILYLDRKGNCISPLYTWQDQRAQALCPRLTDLTGYAVAPGYGLATHCALMEAGAVPAGADKLCTIMDYAAYLFCGKKTLLMHATNAASLGFFRVEEGCFDSRALKLAGIDPELLPPVTRKTVVQGHYRNIPVAVSIGDNQASFLGAVSQPETTALVNFGTGSQISRMSRVFPEQMTEGTVEVRPYLDDTYLLCGSALCGGRAYALLEGFFRRFLTASGAAPEDCWQVLNALALEGLGQTPELLVETTFCGTRQDPGKRGSICNLGEENFTPEAFAAGILLGMARELCGLLREIPGEPAAALTASGNAIRRNPALAEAVDRVFGIPVEISACQEEAAAGAARFAAEAVRNGILP